MVYGFKLVSFFLGITALCVFASQTAQEYTYGTLRNLLVRQPARMKILIGKWIAMSIFAKVLVIVTALVSIASSYALSGKGGVSTEAWLTSEGLHYFVLTLINIILATIGFGTLGMILGLLFRSPITSIAVGVLWTLILESILLAALPSTAPWLPGANIGNIAQGGGSNGVAYTHSLWVSALFLLLASAIVAALFKRRDVAN